MEVVRVRTISTTQFIAGIAQNAADVAILDLTPTGLGTTTGDREAVAAGRHMRAKLREIRIVSVQNLAWEIWLFGTSIIGGAALAAEKFYGRWPFAVADGVQATGDTFFYYYKQDLNIAYMDQAQSGKIYLRLVNRTAGAKLAAAAGAIEIELVFELIQRSSP